MVSQLFALGASATGGDLIIFQNIPQAEPQLDDERIQLVAVHLHDGGYFTKASTGLSWDSSNVNVAEVDQQGWVTFSGQNGRTYVTVTDGVYSDRIALEYKLDPKTKNVTTKIVKEEGERYDVIQRALHQLSMEEKVGQMLMPDFRTFSGKNVTEMLPQIEALVKKYHLGGVILFSENVVTTEQTARLIYYYQKASEKFGLLITIDQEGGIVTRLQSGTDFPGSMALGAARDPELSYRIGKAIGEELSVLGINTNFAPIMDVNNNPDNPVIGVRSFGENPALVAEHGTAYIQGLQSAGVAATAKHFPGHGDTTVDSHLGIAEVPHDKARLKEMELYPFQKAMEGGIDAIMTAHVTFPKIDGTKAVSKLDGKEIAVPATLSRLVLTELMREEMGFQGVISTDAMDMKAISDHFGPVDAAVRAVRAGADIILMPVGLEEVAEGLYEAVRAGEITEDQLDASVERILTLKVKRGIVKEESPMSISEHIEKALDIVGSVEHKALEVETAARSVTLVKNDGVLPLQQDEENKVVVVGSSYFDDLYTAVKKHQSNAVQVKLTSSYKPTAAQWDEIKKADTVIIGTVTSNVSGRMPTHAQMALVKEINEAVSAPVIALGIRNPYDIMAYSNEVDAYVVQYSFRPASTQAAVDVLFGKKEPTGKLPVTIPSYDGGVLYPYDHGLRY
ncbi:glycoside hydrolase family 3 protein [Ammoniphilus sp. CFH 90114]|uniref:glycoside hydrolase family 3 protein n=1 Tax=Ammoniphilus sp. CFH 90114 TaxID=2493665 RepID=UPI001F0C5EF6|nr:glycoside hydrolase family 3 protein [Ammoniphilus sp. CFH 90114]